MMDFKHSLAVLLLAGTLTLAACGDAEQEPAEVDGVPGLEVSNARMVLNAVEGNPAAVYFDVSFSGELGTSIRAADVAGAKSAELHRYYKWDTGSEMTDASVISMQDGESLSFEPGGLHIMAMEVSPDIRPGSTTEVTLTVAGGDKHSFDAEVLAAGDDR